MPLLSYLLLQVPLLFAYFFVCVCVFVSVN